MYLRPETAQGMFVDFATIQQVSRKKILGIAQIGRSFRNEITPGNFIFRQREFEQMEMEFFVEPGTDEDWHEFWIGERMRWWTDLGLREDHVRIREHDADELSHYSKRTVDIEYRFPFTDWGARGDREPYRLRPQGAPGGLRRGPHLLRPGEERAVPPVRDRARCGRRSRGSSRSSLTPTEEEAPAAKGGTEKRSYLADRRLAPTKVAVLPLSRNEKLAPKPGASSTW